MKIISFLTLNSYLLYCLKYDFHPDFKWLPLSDQTSASFEK